MNSRTSLALVLPLLLLACDKDKRKKPTTDDTAPTHDTGPAPAPDPDCDTGYLDDDGDCVPTECGTGTWGNLEVDESSVYVDIGAAEGGDGSEAAPFTSIQEGLDAAGDADGGMVAVAAGSYPETLELGYHHDGVHLAGRCRELVVIDASVGGESTPGIDVDVKSSEVGVSGVMVSGSHYVGMRVGSGTMTIRDSAVAESEYIGVVAYQAGILATALTMEGCEVRGNTSAGVVALYSGTSVTLRETSIVNTQPDENGEIGYGIMVWGGASLDAEGCEVRGNTSVGVFALDSGTAVTLRETTIEHTQPDKHWEGGEGIWVQDGASLDAEACVVRGNTGAGVIAAVSGTTVTLRVTTIEDTQSDENGEYGFGIQVSEGASLDAEACEVRENTTAGVAAYNSGTAVTLRATTIEDTKPKENGEGGYGIEVQGAASLDAEGCEVLGNTSVGVAAGHSGTSVTLRETSIKDTQPDPSGEFGFGIGVQDGASLDAEDCDVGGNIGAGVQAFGSGSSVTLRGTTIADTRPQENGNGGYGIYVYDGASLDAEVCEVSGNTAAGVLAAHSGTVITLRETRIASTMRREVYTVGTGVTAQASASVMATDIEVSSNEGPGLYVISEDSQLTCSGCTLRDNQYAGVVVVEGASLQLDESLIERTSEQENLGGGVGIFVSPWYGSPPSMSITSTTIQDNPITGVWLSGEGSYSLSGNTIHGGEGWTREGLTKCGDAVYARDGTMAWDGSSGLLLENNELLDGRGAGVFLDDAKVTLSGNNYTDNAVDLVVQGGDCETPPDGYDGEAFSSDVELCPAYDYATCGDEFALYLTLADPESGHGDAFMRPDLPRSRSDARTARRAPPCPRSPTAPASSPAHGAAEAAPGATPARACAPIPLDVPREH